MESFLREHLEIDFIAGRELKMTCGVLRWVDGREKTMHALEQVQEGKSCSDMIGISRLNKIPDQDFLSLQGLSS